jgi:hypothetical protein
VSTDAIRTWTRVSTCRSSSSSHRSYLVNWFSKQSPVALAFLSGWYFIRECPRTALGAFDEGSRNRTQSLKRDLQGPYFCLAFFEWPSRVNYLTILATLLTVVLHAVSRVTCRSFLNLRLCSITLYRPGRVIFLTKSIFTEATEAVNSRPLYRLLCPR